MNDQITLEEQHARLAAIRGAPQSPRGPLLRGTPARLADGRIWLLHDGIVEYSEAWDRLHDLFLLRRSPAVREEDAIYTVCAYDILMYNYVLDPTDATILVHHTPAEALEPALIAAIGLNKTIINIGWCAYMRSAFWANGINPDSIPPAERRTVLLQLIHTGRAAPVTRYMESYRAVRRWRMIATARTTPRGKPADANV